MIGATLLGPRADAGFATYPPDHNYWFTPRGQPTVSGVAVSEELAMTNPTVFACGNKLSKTLATLPVHVFRTLPGDRKESMPDHPVRRMFNVRFNDEALAVPTRWAMHLNKILWGNAYFEVVWSHMGEPMAMRLLYSRYMTVERDPQTGRLVYKYREPGQPPVDLPPERVLHIPGLSYNGLVGLSVIGFARETIGLGIATAQYRAAFLGNGAPTGIVIERPVDAPPLSPQGGIDLVNSFDERHQGSGNAFRTALLREGMTLKTIGMPMADAQFCELAQLTDRQIYGIFDVQPSKIHDNERSTYSNVEQQNIDWSVDSLLPWCVLTENAVNATLLEEPYYLKHNLAGLQRGDIKARHEAYSQGRQTGMYCTNDLRRKEDLDPIDGGDGDFWRPANMVDISQEKKQIKTVTAIEAKVEATRQEMADNAQALAEIKGGIEDAGKTVSILSTELGELVEETSQRHNRHVKQLGDSLGQQSQKLVTGFLKVAKTVDRLRQEADEKQRAELSGLLLDPATRAVTKETKAIGSADKRCQKALGNDGFLAWVDKFYTDHQVQLYEMFRSSVGYIARQISLSEPEAHAALRGFCEQEATVSSGTIKGACVSSRSPDEVLHELERWKDEKPRMMVHVLMGRLCGENQTTEDTEEEESR